MLLKLVPGAFEVRTPENVTFEFELAGLAARALAWTIDIFVVAVLYTVVMLLASLFVGALGGFGLALAFVGGFLLMWWFTAVTEWWFGGQTLGKKAVGLRTIQASGVRMTFVQAVIRNLVRIVDLLPALYLVGGVSMLLDSRSRRLGDMAAGTVVVRERRSPLPTRIVPPHERYNTFIADTFVAHAARRITPPERDAMVKLSLRRDDLPLAMRHTLFTRLANHLEARIGVPRPPYFSEEKYVLNLTAVVLSSSSSATARNKGPF